MCERLLFPTSLLSVKSGFLTSVIIFMSSKMFVIFKLFEMQVKW